MKLTKLRAVAVGASVSALALIMPPASAATPASVSEAGLVSAGTATRDGVDFDAACKVDGTSPAGINANNVRSPDGNTPYGCYSNNGNVVSTYDGNTESTDISNVTLEVLDADTSPVRPHRLKATCTVDGEVPEAGSTVGPAFTTDLDLPDDTFQGTGCKVMFSNEDKNTNGDNPNTGCARTPTGRIRDQQGHWEDGYHTFIGFDVSWDGSKWIHSAQVGDYVPTPDGGFFFNELGIDAGLGWDNQNPDFNTSRWDASVVTAAGGPTTFSVELEGIYRTADPLCVGGIYERDFGSDLCGAYPLAPGIRGCGAFDNLVDVKGLTTADQTFTSPVTIPLSILCGLPLGIGDLLCQSDITSVGGFIFFSDTTDGDSLRGQLASNIVDIAYSGGAIGLSDTLGPGPNCPTPTFGGTVPDNPNWVANKNEKCEIDDDILPNLGDPVPGSWRGTFLSEWWPTDYDVVYP